MKTQKLTEKFNPLFGRKEVTIEIENALVPSYSELNEILSKEYSADKGSIKIIKVHTRFGVQKFIVQANVYNSKEEKEKIEVKSKKDKLLEEAALKAEAPSAEAQ